MESRRRAAAPIVIAFLLGVIVGSAIALLLSRDPERSNDALVGDAAPRDELVDPTPPKTARKRASASADATLPNPATQPKSEEPIVAPADDPALQPPVVGFELGAESIDLAQRTAGIWRLTEAERWDRARTDVGLSDDQLLRIRELVRALLVDAKPAWDREPRPDMETLCRLGENCRRWIDDLLDSEQESRWHDLGFHDAFVGYLPRRRVSATTR